MKNHKMTTPKQKNKNETVTTKARVAKRSATTAPLKEQPATTAHGGSKTDKILGLLKRPRWRHFERARKANRLAAELGAWLPKRRDRQEDGMPVESFKSSDGDRSYRLPSK